MYLYIHTNRWDFVNHDQFLTVLARLGHYALIITSVCHRSYNPLCFLNRLFAVMVPAYIRNVNDAVNKQQYRLRPKSGGNNLYPWLLCFSGTALSRRYVCPTIKRSIKASATGNCNIQNVCTQYRVQYRCSLANAGARNRKICEETRFLRICSGVVWSRFLTLCVGERYGCVRSVCITCNTEVTHFWSSNARSVYCIS